MMQICQILRDLVRNCQEQEIGFFLYRNNFEKMPAKCGEVDLKRSVFLFQETFLMTLSCT